MESNELSVKVGGSDVDRAQLEAMGKEMPEMLLEILNDFESSFREELQRLLDPNKEATVEDWVGYFHRAKGSGGTLGLAALQGESARLEDFGKAGNLPDDGELENFDSLVKRSCLKAREILESFVA